MKHVMTSILLLSILMACGRSDQPSSTGNGDGIEPPQIRVLLGIEETPFPTPTAYIPIVDGTIVEIDAGVLGNRPSVAFTLQEGQVLRLVSSLKDIPRVDWFVEADPLLFESSIDGHIHTLVEGYEPYPANGLVLTPLQKGITSFKLSLRFRPCKNCEISTTYTVYEITVN
jgi:hypothetical protein